MIPIWPTARGWVFMVCGCMWFSVSMINHSLFTLCFACAIAAICLAGLCAAIFSLRGIVLERGPIGDASSGQAVAMPVIIKNKIDRRRQPVCIIEKLTFSPGNFHTTLVPPLKAREEYIANRRILALKRGEHDLDKIILRGGDIAGLFYRQKKFSFPNQIFIEPGTEAISDLHLQRKHAIVSTAGTPVSLAGSSQDFYGVREYNRSDGLKYIHWKSSARFGNLMVREFERNTIMSVGVLLDAYQPDVSGDEHWSNLEYQVRAAASVADHLAGMYCNISLAAGGNKELFIPPQTATHARQQIMYELALLESGNVTVKHMAYQLAEVISPSSLIFCFSLSANKELADTLNVLQNQGFTIRWYCADKAAFTPKEHKFSFSHNSENNEKFPVPVEKLHPAMRLESVLGEIR